MDININIRIKDPPVQSNPSQKIKKFAEIDDEENVNNSNHVLPHQSSLAVKVAKGIVAVIKHGFGYLN